MTSRKSLPYILAGICLALLTLVFLTASHPVVDSYFITGRVQALSGNLLNCTIRYTTEDKMINRASLPRIDVKPDGSFSGIVNVPQNSEVFLYADKEGYTPGRVSVVLTDTEGENKVPPVKIVPLYRKSLRHVQAPTTHPRLAVYESKPGDCPTFETPQADFPVHEINYFKNLELVPNCTPASSLLAFKTQLGVKGYEFKQDVFFLLSQGPDGTAMIQESAPSDLGPGTPTLPAAITARQTGSNH